VSERIEDVLDLTSPPPESITVALEPANSEGPVWVIAQAEAELAERYGGLTGNELGIGGTLFDPPTGAFLVARCGRDAVPIGGVGIRSVADDVAEVRRLWVDPSWRNRGVAKSLMRSLELTARELGFSRLELGTGDRQHEAVALYESTGWRRVTTDGTGQELPDSVRKFVKTLG
jgi:GNAT superfamily N-acetyltransferase